MRLRLVTHARWQFNCTLMARGRCSCFERVGGSRYVYIKWPQRQMGRIHSMENVPLPKRGTIYRATYLSVLGQQKRGEGSRTPGTPPPPPPGSAPWWQHTIIKITYRVTFSWSLMAAAWPFCSRKWVCQTLNSYNIHGTRIMNTVTYKGWFVCIG